MKQRYSLRSNAVKFRLLTLTLLTFVLGGKTAWAQTGYTLNHTSGTKTYYIHTVNTVSAASNNTIASGPQAYKFRVSESFDTPTTGTQYDYIQRINVTGGSVTFVFLTSQPVGFGNTTKNDKNQSSFTVSAGTLTLKLDPTNYTSSITLRRVGVDASFENTENTSVPFHLPNINGAANAKNIIIEGLPPLESQLLYPESGVENDTATFLAGRQFVIDNAANISSVSLTDGQPTYTGKQASLPIFRVETGTLHLTNVTLQNSINCALGGNAHNGIYVMTSNSNTAGTARNVDVKLTHCWLTKLVSRSTDVAPTKSGYPGLGIQYSSKEANGRGDVLVTRCKFSNISSLNGHDSAIRSISSCTAYVTIDRTTVCHNYGGGIRWQGLPAKQPLQIQYSTIKGNYSILSGGGIMAKAPINLVGSKILNNKAHVNGGGINYMAFDEAGQTEDAAGKLYPKNLSLTMDATTIIDGNEAETGDGGGLYVWGRLINLTANVSPAGNNYIYYEYNDDGTVAGPYKMELNLNGATISNNQAYNNGGGIQIFRDGDASCYLLDCKLNSGTITGNKALNGTGGGVGISQTATPNPAHVNSDHPARNISLSTGGTADDLTIYNNDAKFDGGGIYLYSINDGAGWNQYQKFETIVTLNDRTKIIENKAYTVATTSSATATDHGGGGVFVQEGNVTIEGTPEAGDANNPLIEANETQYSGAGICLIKGNVTAKYCRVYSNKATVTGQSRGGGLYLKEGNITLNNSKIYNNTTKTYGGGIYCLGTISLSMVKLTNSEVKGNRAGYQGGGIYLHEGIIDINSSTIGGLSYSDANVAGTAGNGDYKGGGIYTQSGEVNIIDSKISYNLANRRGGGIYTKSGPVTIKGSEISYNRAGWRKSDTGTTMIDGHSQATGGGIHTDGGLVRINPNENESTPTQIIYNRASLNGGGIFTGTDSGTKGKVEIYGNNPTYIEHLINIMGNEAENGSGGGIFCLGDADKERYVLLRRVNLSNNKAGDGSGSATQPSELSGVTSRCGGGLYLQDGLIDMNLCTVDNNTAKLNGGGVNNHAGNINVQSCYIRNNEAGMNNTNAGSGGGIFTKSGTIGVNIWGTPATVQSEARRTEITGNKAKLNGGGLNTHNGKILVQGNSDDANERILINNNEATSGSGGAIFCMGEDGGSTTETFIELKHVDLKNNKALEGEGSYTDEDGNTVSKGCGGGVYLQLGEIDATDVVIQSNFANENGGGINNHKGFVDIWGCAIGGDSEALGNEAGNSGGGIYTNEGNIDIEDYIEHGNGSSHRFESYVKYNKAGQNGGGLNTHSGIIYINRNERDHEINIAYNTANKGGGIYANAGSIWAYNAHIDNNTATENGGGANNHAGDINIFGGTVYNNTATEGRGGGVFTYVGDVNIKPFPSTITNPTLNDGTRISNNLAKLNGGGINNHTGRVDVRYASMRNNTASLGNGGGIFCEGPHGNSTGFTIRLLESQLKENKTRGEDGTPEDPTGRGGGIYLKYGSIYAHNSDIIENFANINGGGLDNHDGTILAYGCDIKNNEARHGRGGGIYTQTGTITTGPSLYNSSVRSTVIQGNKAYINGGGINNHEGDIFLNGDHILENIAETGHGGGIYINSGTIEMAGGKIANNEAKLGDGGGVWSGGGNFHIHRREGKPIVEIVDVDVTGTGTATVHYHCIDGGSTDLTDYGILYGKVEADVEAATGAGGTVSSQTGGTAGTETGCYRINLTGLESGTTYYVKAFATNSTPLTDYSNVGSFTTFDDKPSVISGTVAEITSTTAQGSGKLVKSNNDTLCGVVYIQKDGHLGSYDNLVLTTTGAQIVYEEGPHNDGYFYTLDMTGLTPGKKYFARAYASNANGTAYGDTVIFYTKKDVPVLNGNVVDVTSITDKKATFTFTIPALSSRVIKTYGFVWSTDNDPSLNEDNAHIWKESTDAIAANTSKTITVTIDTLHSATHFYVRAFASYEEFSSPVDPSNYALSVPTEFFTKDADGNPVTRSIRLSGITQTSVDFTGMIIDKGSPATIKEYGVCYHTEPNPTTANGKAYFTGDYDINTEYTKPITGLELNTTYYLRAYAINDDDKTGYSNEFTFTTLAAKIPHAYITQIDGITQTAAQVHVTVDSQGGGDITDWGIKYNDSDDISTAIDINKPGGGTTLSGTSFDVNLPKSGETALVKKTDYYVWVYATNSVGTYTTSHWTKFTTKYDEPTVTIATVSENAYDASASAGQQNSARFAATATPTGTPVVNIKTKGVCYSTNQNPLRMESDYTDSRFDEATGDWGAAQTIDYAGKVLKYPNTKYYVRAYASVNVPVGDDLEDIVYGEEANFVTLPSMLTGEVTDLTKTSATLKGTINSRDPNEYLIGGKYGVCWSEDPTVPTRTSGFYAEESITSSNHSPNFINFEVNATTGLTADKTYKYRAYYMASGGEIAYAPVATFTTKRFTLTVNSNNTAYGTVSPTSVDMNPDDTQYVYPTAAPGYKLSGWTCTGTGAITSGSDPVLFTMGNSDATLTATFIKDSYTLTLVADPDEGGDVAITGSPTVEYGDTRTITATAKSGWTFTGWTVEGAGSSVADESLANTTFTMGTANATVTANFESTRGSKSNTSMNVSPSTPSTSSGAFAPRPRDIYPAPAREPWDWDDDFTLAMTNDTIVENDTVNDERGGRPTYETPVDLPQIIENKATEGNGGGIYLNKDEEDPVRLIFADGNINFNTAKLNGGGIYIDTTAFMQMYGTCEVNGNMVPAGQHGGGIYLAGRLYVGRVGDGYDDNGLRVNKNFASSTLDLGNYKALVAFSVADKDLATATGFTQEQLPSKTLGTVVSGTTTVLDKLLVLANAITSISDITAANLVDALGLADEAALKAMTVTEYNTAKTSLLAEANNALNNVYLPRDDYDYYQHINHATYDDYSNVIALLCDISAKHDVGETGVQYPLTKIGFSVPHGYCPVIATSDALWGDYKNTTESLESTYESWLFKLMPSSGLSLLDCALFEDSDTYIAIHSRNNIYPFLGKYIYLWGSWPNPLVDEDPEIATGRINLMGEDESHEHYQITYKDNPKHPGDADKQIAVWEILSPEGLSWFTSYVNGLNVFSTGDADHKQWHEDVNPYAEAKLACDIDMGNAFWVPIGSVTRYVGPSGSSGIYEDDNTHRFKGKFDGQGHTITRLECRFLTGVKHYGLFGHLTENAEVKNVFIDAAEYETTDSGRGFNVGGVAGLMSDNAVISASEARVNINLTFAKKDDTYVGGLVGKVNDNSANERVLIHSSMAMPEFKGTANYMGGLVGYLGTNDSLVNSFANSKFPDASYDMTDEWYIGGLVGVNNGLVENCYSRLQGNEPKKSGTPIFGWLAGANLRVATASSAYGIKYSYVPAEKTPYVKADSGKDPFGHGTYSVTQRFSGKYGFKHRDQQMTSASGSNTDYITNKTSDTLIGGLLHSLNGWVKATAKGWDNDKEENKKGFAVWTRTMASPINDDYPVLILPDFNSVGSADGVFMKYNHDVNDMIDEYTQLAPAEFPAPAIYLYDTLASGLLSGDPKPLAITKTNIGTTNDNVMLAIHEDVGVTVADAALSTGLKARVGVTIKNSRDDETDPNWHLLSSAVYNVPMGLQYHTDAAHVSAIASKPYLEDEVWGDPAKSDPPKTTWYQSDDSDRPDYNADKIGYFPTNTPYGTNKGVSYLNDASADPKGFFDLYVYSENFYHWINMKREGAVAANSSTGADIFDHWHQDKNNGDARHYRINYENETVMVNGKGYLMALSQESMMQADGVLNTGTLTTPVTLTAVGINTPPNGAYSGPVPNDQEWRSLNLIGNPYQSYLDFKAFADENSTILYSKNNVYSYATRDDSNWEYTYYTSNSSDNPVNGTRYIHPHQGFFVKVKEGGTLTFKDDMRRTTGELSKFRSDDHINYPLINLFCYDANGKRNYTTVEVNRPEAGGGPKMETLRSGDALIYVHFEDQGYQTAFIPVGVNTVPVRFEAFEDGVFNLRWETFHADFSYLHLIDNLTGADVDCLTTNEYVFEGKTSDYLSRFKLVFDCTGLEEFEEETIDSKVFAFQFGEELIVNGEGAFQMFDLHGHCLLSTQVYGAQSNIGLPKVAAGIYLLRLTGNNQVKVQKLVIK